MLLEEISMWPPSWLYALGVRLQHVRHEAGQKGVDPRTPLVNPYGGMPLVNFSGDFFQLKPVRKPSLIQRPRVGDSYSTRQGQLLFYSTLDWVLTLGGSERFVHPVTKKRCEYLPELLQAMREKRAIPARVWERLEQCTITATDDTRLEEGLLRDGSEVAVQWEAVARMMQYRVRREAQRQRKLVFYVQAIDEAREWLLPEDYKQMLQFPNWAWHGHAWGVRERCGCVWSARSLRSMAWSKVPRARSRLSLQCKGRHVLVGLA